MDGIVEINVEHAKCQFYEHCEDNLLNHLFEVHHFEDSNDPGVIIQDLMHRIKHIQNKE
jgi:hypothetical protein